MCIPQVLLPPIPSPPLTLLSLSLLYLCFFSAARSALIQFMFVYKKQIGTLVDEIFHGNHLLLKVCQAHHAGQLGAFAL